MLKLLPPTVRVLFSLIIFSACTLFSLELQAQIVSCPPNLMLECDEVVPAVDPTTVTVSSYCKTPNCCDGMLAVSDYCNADLSSCMKVALTCIGYTPDCEAIFKFKVVNTCSNALSNIAFTIPAGATGTDPVDGDTYISPCGGSYLVETPNSGPDAGTLKFEGSIPQGGSDCFEFTIEGLDKLPDFIDVNPKYGPNDDFLSVSTYGCGNANILSKVHVVDKDRVIGCTGIAMCRIYKVNFDCPLVVSGRETCEQVIMRDDDAAAPTYDFIPSNQTLACGDPIVFTPPTATDDCGAVTIESLGTVVLGGCPGETIHIQRWQARDECFNYAGTVEQRLTVPASCCTAPGMIKDEQEPSTEKSVDAFNLQTPQISMDLVPNPANGPFEVQLKGFRGEDAELTVYDMLGNVVFQSNAARTAGTSVFLNPDALQMKDGIFVVTLRYGSSTITQKIVISR